MSLIINHNLSAMQTHRNLALSSASMSKSIEKLSSGYKINVGADDPSGLIISEQLRSQISGLDRAIRNSSEAYNLIGIAEGALNEMNELLKKMRALAIHAANSGVTSPEQVEADQAEMDSGIQTLDRIANTTKYSDQFLLNGSKQLVYDRNTVVDSTMDHPLVDLEATRIDQIFKRQGVKMTIGFTGVKNQWQANTKTSAQRAYFEAEANNPLCEINKNQITAKQEFILTGTQGSRLFSFAEGTNLGTIVAGINNVKDSTGVGATLIFASNVRIDQTVNACTAAGTGVTGGLTGFNDTTAAYLYKSGDIQIYGANLNNPGEAKISDVKITANVAASFIVGKNCDGDGKIYAKVIDKSNNVIEWYKDKECTMLIGKGTDTYFATTNKSDLPGSPDSLTDGLFLKLDPNNAENLDVYEIAVVGQRMDNQKDMTVTGLQGWTDTANSVMSGVNLGFNTSDEGQIFFKYTPLTYATDGKSVIEFKVEAFSDSSMQPQYLVGSSGITGNGVLNQQQTVRIESVTMANGKDSGLNITVNIPPKAGMPLPNGQQVGNVTFDNVGIRLYAQDYGSQETIRMQNKAGNLFYYFREGDTMEKVMVNSGTTVQIAGQDAQIGLNGAPVLTQGLVASTTTPDFSGSIAFNAGVLGKTTIAVAGHEKGSLYSKATDLQAVAENEVDIKLKDRLFEPPSVVVPLTGVKNQNGNPVSMYLDFNDLDDTVKAMLDMTNIPADATFTIAYADGTPPKLTITTTGTANTPGNILAVDIPVDPEKLAAGYHLSDPSLKGLFVKTSSVINIPASKAATGGAAATTNIYGGSTLLEVNTYATNPRENTTENLFNFLGGMQFQLGNTEGDQDRTVYSIPSMVMANVGRLEWEGNVYCLQDVMGGGVASLARDPILAMRILGKAVDDVSTLRARLGAFQKNMLQTNINALSVAVENITKTESAIRDTDMAAESTEFTKNQVMVSAGTSMLAQANQVSQNVLQLLGR